MVALDEASPTNQTTLASRLDYSKNRLVHDVDHLEQLCLVKREPLPTDRRSNSITITGRGRTTRRRIQHRIHAGEHLLLRDVAPATRERFARLAADVADTLHRGS